MQNRTSSLQDSEHDEHSTGATCSRQCMYDETDGYLIIVVMLVS